MGYFSNGEEGNIYQETYCLRCVHWNDEHEYCPVWALQMDYNGDPVTKDLLDELIPPTRDGCSNEQCRLFYERRE